MKVKPPELKQIADKNGLPWTAEATASAPSDHGPRSAQPGRWPSPTKRQSGVAQSIRQLTWMIMTYKL